MVGDEDALKEMIFSSRFIWPCSVSFPQVLAQSKKGDGNTACHYGVIPSDTV